MWDFSVLKRWRLFLPPKQLAIVQACLIGLVSGLAAVLLSRGVGWLGTWRVQASYLGFPWLVLPGLGLLGGLMAGWLVERWAPEAAGSGIPQVKAGLAGVPIPLGLRVASLKLVSGMLALGAGLPLGREGPTVQVGAALAAQLSRWVPTAPDYRRQLIAAGAGAGLAAAFNTPVAAVLFVVEELLKDVSGLTLGPAILAAFIGAVLSRVLGGQSLDLSLIALVNHTGFGVMEIPFYLLLGVLAGILGAVFNRGILASLDVNQRVLKLGLTLRVGLAGLVCGLVISMLPDVFRNSSGLREILVGLGANWHLALLALAVQFGLTMVAYGAGAPGGLFAPTLLMGSSLGYLVGSLEQHWLGATPPTAYALVGMGAVFCAVARVPITAIVITFELTNDFNLILPLMIACAVSYLVAEQLYKGSLYDILLEFQGIQLPSTPTASQQLGSLTAGEVMQSKVETLDRHLSLKEVRQAFSRSHHRGFPVMEDGLLVGIVAQSDLDRLAESSEGATLADIMTPQPLTVRPTDSLTEVLYLLNRYSLSRLPVTEGRRLVGIITRSDILRAEVDLIGEGSNLGPRPEPSYVVYQTRAPATGQGRLLVPLVNPRTAPYLLRWAGALARARNYELEALHVILVPRTCSPAETAVDPSADALLQQASRFGRQEGLSVHTQVRVAHDVAQAVLEAIKERRIDLVLMGWKGTTKTPGRVFSQIVDTLIRQAPCEVILVNLKGTDLPQRWLVPMGGGPNAQQAVQLLPALLKGSKSDSVTLCQVLTPETEPFTGQVLAENARFLEAQLGHPVTTLSLCARSVPQAVVQIAREGDFEAIVLGASRERLLQKLVYGNIPEEIARLSDCTLVLVSTP
ncbi:chloride channel protein [Anthocerotibacter panamensis]|uniref:chloride channel protein n=1 Tax=Anthocerotibacter panamensis TaxID=2857077 RepID=UPI001C40614C|nr:chloride channel protein [Anthocerotibacter panamensis]